MKRYRKVLMLLGDKASGPVTPARLQNLKQRNCLEEGTSGQYYNATSRWLAVNRLSLIIRLI